MNDRATRVMHVITGLGTGGAEMTLYKLLRDIDPDRFSSVVVSLTDRGSLASDIETLGVPVIPLRMGSAVGAIRGLLRLISLIKEKPPHILQSWLYAADLAALIAKRCSRNTSKLCWNIRCAKLRKGDVAASTLVLRRALSLFSRIPDVVIVNSRAGMQAHEAIGYRPSRWELIHNGFDLDGYQPDPVAAAEVRREMRVSYDAELIGIVARFDPLKGHVDFVRAAAEIVAARPKARFVLVGRDIDSDNRKLVSAIDGAGVHRYCHLLGERRDMPKILAALDILVSASYSEGFSNVIGEAMCCGVPCVCTDTGDSAFLVGDTGVVVPAHDASALARACIALLSRSAAERRALGTAARGRINRLFSLSVATRRYEQVYEELRNKQR